MKCEKKSIFKNEGFTRKLGILQPVDEKELKGWHELLFSGMD